MVGSLDASTIDPAWQSRGVRVVNQKAALSSPNEKPPLSSILSSLDFETAAERTLSKKAWAFFSSAATDLISLNANRSFFDRVWFRPRILRDVKSADTTCRVSDVKSNLPVIVAPAAMARLAHKSGEKGIAKACAKKGIIQCVRLSLVLVPDSLFFFVFFVYIFGVFPCAISV